MSLSAHSSAQIAAPSSAADLSRREHRFFTRSAVVIALLVVIGFGFSTYVRTRPGATAFGGPTLKPVVRLHAAISTGWIALLVFQTFLVATRRTPLHRRLGLLGGALASGVIVFGWIVAVRSTNPAANPQAFEFFILPSSELLVFSVLIACALLWRNIPSTHKRLMLLGTLALIPAATTRPVPPGSTLFLLGMVGIPEAVFILALVAHDLRAIRRVHPATIWGKVWFSRRCFTHLDLHNRCVARVCRGSHPVRGWRSGRRVPCVRLAVVLLELPTPLKPPAKTDVVH